MITCSQERIKRDIEWIAQFNTSPGNGTTRFSYSQEDRQARDYLISQMRAIGLRVSVDPVGNIRGRLDGRDETLPVVMTGSHIDTVINGGNFDGVAGVIAGLEAIRCITEHDLKPDHPIELIVFVEEEGPNFNFPLAGSRLLTGAYGVEDMKRFRNSAGLSMYEAAVAFGLTPDEMPKHVLSRGDIRAMIELHIEQSVVLDELKIPVGIVEAVAGRKWLEITIKGKSNHAGATPMRFRNDPMVGAAEIIAKLKDIVTEKAFETTVGTVGRIQCFPNQPNVIPEKVVFTIDVRDTDPMGIEIVEREIDQLSQTIAKAYGLDYHMEMLSRTDPILFSKEVVGVIESVAIENKINHLRMNSGALHDSCLLAEVTQVGMIFVPSIGGRSHCADENTAFADIALATDVLIGTLLKLSGI